jgi:hypothetical protein
MLDLCTRTRFLRSLTLAAAALLTFSSTVLAQTPTVAWNANTESDLAGYVVQYGTQSGNPTSSLDVGNVTSRQFTGLTAGATYYFRVVAYNASGQSSGPSNEASYLVPAPPTPTVTLTSISPTSGPTTGGTVITLTGTNFVAGSSVQVGGVAATAVTLVSTTQMRATTPAGTAGARTVQVTTPSGQSAGLTSAFTYVAPATPTITSISPTSGPTAGGTQITLTGTNFVSGATVRVGGVAATGVTFTSATQLRATTPAGAAGVAAVQVTNPSGQSVTLNNAFTYTAPATTPTLTSLTPTSGPTAGGTQITLTGTNFVSGATVRVGGVAATGVTFTSATQLRATTPAGAAGVAAVQVTNPSGQSVTLNNAFTYTAPATTPTLTSLTPTSGPTAGGTQITLTGTNFVSGATVRIGGIAATGVTFTSATQLRATTPAGTAGARAVQVTNPNGQSSTLNNAFTYTTSAAPRLSLVNPFSGSTAGGTQIYLSGANFAPGATVRVRGVLATNVTFQSTTRLWATTPAGAAGSVAVQVTNPDGQSSTLNGAFTYTSTSALTSTSTARAQSTVALESSATAAATGAVRRYLAEGVQTADMNTRLALANPQSVDANVVLTFADASGRTSRLPVIVPARARRTVDLSTIPALAGTTFSTLLESDVPVALDRLVSWDARGVSASLEAAVDQPSTHWYFAEGSTIDPFELFYLVQNPNATAAQVQVRYLLPQGQPVTKTYTVAAGARATIWVDREDPALARVDVAADITSVNGVPVVVERSLYLSEAGATAPRGGDTAAGATTLATTWRTSGNTGDRTMRLALANPGSAPATVSATYATESGAQVVKTYVVAANSRHTVNVATEDPALANAAVNVSIVSADGTPIVVERTIGWGANGVWDELVSGAAVAEGGVQWLAAEGEQGGARQTSTSLVVFNTQATAVDVTVTLLFEDAAEVSAVFPVDADGQLVVPVAQAFPAAEGKRFSVLVEAADPSAAIAVDRVIYWRAGDATRTAGADAAATRLR